MAATLCLLSRPPILGRSARSTLATWDGAAGLGLSEILTGYGVSLTHLGDALVPDAVAPYRRVAPLGCECESS